LRVVVSAGNAFDALRRRPPSSNAALFPRVPQLGVLRAVDVVVSHGGNNTTLEALAAGKPLVVVPFGGDQVQNARRVETLGVGVALSPDRLDERSVAAALDRALSCRERAAVIGRSLAGVDGTAASVALLEALGS
jgi:UDP:flavonoid glycosyltransferase YjiC (YdhE family)